MPLQPQWWERPNAVAVSISGYSSRNEWGGRGIVRLCGKWPRERRRCVPSSASEWEGNKADAPIDQLCRLLLRVHGQNDRARPGLWTMCSALTDRDHRFYWSTRIIATMLRLIAIMIAIKHSPRRMALVQIDVMMQSPGCCKHISSSINQKKKYLTCPE